MNSALSGMWGLAGLSGRVLPSQTFFTPTKAFKKWIEAQTLKIVDCGSGQGLLPSLYPEKIIGIDIMERDSYLGKVYVGMDATRFPFTNSHICLIARPDGSGWIYDCIQNALEAGAMVVYVGVERNYERDLECYEKKLLVNKAGKEGEQAWQILRQRN